MTQLDWAAIILGSILLLAILIGLFITRNDDKPPLVTCRKVRPHNGVAELTPEGMLPTHQLDTPYSRLPEHEKNHGPAVALEDVFARAAIKYRYCTSCGYSIKACNDLILADDKYLYKWWTGACCTECDHPHIESEII